eukprot:5334821-Amphidinium_carterae.1
MPARENMVLYFDGQCSLRPWTSVVMTMLVPRKGERLNAVAHRMMDGYREEREVCEWPQFH